jgi:murein DD-endopeptidase MepM/ murein hydrolase activator NlpD
VVRSFPSDRRLTAALASALLLAVAALAAPLAHAEDDLKHKQKRVKKQISRAHHDLDESSADLRNAVIKLRTAKTQLTAARKELATTRVRLGKARVRDQEMQVKLDEAIADLTAAREALEQGKQDVQAKKDEVGQMAANVYEMGDPRLMSLAGVLGAEDLDDITMSTDVTDAVMTEENSRLDELTAAKVLLKVHEGNVEKKKDAVAVRRQEAADNLALMQQLEQQAVEQRSSVRKLFDERAVVARRASRIKARDARVLAGLERQENRIAEKLRQRALRLAAQHKGSAPRPSGGYLSYPVQGGYITSPYGYRVHPIYGYYSLHDGTDFGAGGCGKPLVAAADGRVSSRYWSDVYGNRLVLDYGFVRGVGLASIYNHATSYTVGVGQRVRRGQVIGYMGTTGWSTGCHLHFTVLVNGRTVDPVKWF